MKLIICDDNGNEHIVIEKVEREFSTRHVGERVMDYVNRIERCGAVGRAQQGYHNGETS